MQANPPHPLSGTAISLPPWPHFEEDEVNAAIAVLRSGKVNYWTGGECRAFEEEFARYVGTTHAISLANGTLALELALRAFDVGPGDEVIVPARTFIATASCVVAVGATPVIADVDPESQGISPDSVRRVLTSRTKAIIPVHLAGWPSDMDALMQIAQDHRLSVVEDCAQSHGATLGGRKAGSFGQMAAFSFCQDKIMTTAGEGGMLVTNDPELWLRAWEYKDHGKSHEAVFHRDHPPGFRWLHESFGSNFRMTEVQAAIGRMQLRKLDAWVNQRRHLATILNQSFADVSCLRRTIPPKHVGHAYYKYYVFLDPGRMRAGWDQGRVVIEAANRGIPCMTGGCGEIYREVAFTSRGWGPSSPLPFARQLERTSLMLPLHPTMREQDVQSLADGLKAILSNASRP